MQKIIFYIQKHLLEHLQKGWKGIAFLIFVPIFIFSCIAYRYISGIDIYFNGLANAFVFKLLFFSVPFFVIVFAYIFVFEKTEILQKQNFWILSVLIISVLFLNQFSFIFDVDVFDSATRYFFKKFFFNIECCILYLILPIIYWFVVHRKSNPDWQFYGFTQKGFDAKAYFFMLLVMLPLLYWASFRSDFLDIYPRYKAGMMENYWQISPYFTVSAYEISYSLQFICLELFFRGFIVLSLSKYLGSGSVWVMVAVYVFIHFGKPLSETVGSFFGGYILGVIAYYSRSILGGIFIHLCVALGMEVFAYWQI
jgi:hypothetical protein